MGKTLDGYRRERLLRQAIERNFEIIGEAMNRLAQHDPDTAGRISKHRRIAGRGESGVNKAFASIKRGLQQAIRHRKGKRAGGLRLHGKRCRGRS